MTIDRHRNSKARKAQRSADAKARNEATAKLSISERLANLDKLGLTAQRERKRLADKALTAAGKQLKHETPTQITLKAEQPKRERRARKGAK